jgi:hypothetical protein
MRVVFLTRLTMADIASLWSSREKCGLGRPNPVRLTRYDFGTMRGPREKAGESTIAQLLLIFLCDIVRMPIYRQTVDATTSGHPAEACQRRVRKSKSLSFNVSVAAVTS